MTSEKEFDAGLDPGAKTMLDIIAKAQAKGVPALHEVSPAEARAMNQRSKDLFGSDGPAMDVLALTIAGPNGDIPARLYRPANGTLPVVIYYHGGGWVIGGLDSHDGLCRHIAKGSSAAVLSVDYRMAPEDPFPAAVEDSYAALEWVAAHGATHDLDPQRIAVAGDSAGGNIAAVVAIMARDNAGPSIALQALLYPATDMHLVTESHRRFTRHLLTPESIAWFKAHYLRSAADRDDWRASPARATRLSGLPPAFVLTAGFDPLHDEGRAYAEGLEAAGGRVAYRCYEGQIHGFLTLDKVIPEALDAVAETAAAVIAALR